MKFAHLMHAHQRLVLFNAEVSETHIQADFAWVGRNLGGTTVVANLAKDHTFTVEIPQALQRPSSAYAQQVTFRRIK